jgi:hypothetical protein
VPLRGGPPREIALTGDFVQTGPPGTTNLNGIALARGGRTLILVQSNTGKLFTAHAQTGVTREIHLGGANVVNGDGLLLRGRTLFVVQNRLNQIAQIELGHRLARGEVERIISDPAFDVPTTIASFGPFLYAVNARFGTPSPTTAAFGVVRVP